MKLNKFLFTALLLAAPGAHADDDNYLPSLPHGAPVVGTVVPGAANGQGVNCNNKAELSKYLTDQRMALRKEYAANVSRNIPHLGLQSPLSGVACIHSNEAFSSAYNASDDSFTLTCLAHSRVPVDGRMEDMFSHIIQLKLKAEPTCVSMPAINDFVRGTQCLMPNGLQLFLQGMRNCINGLETDAQRGVAPQFMAPPVAYSIDGAWYNDLLQHKPSVGNIIDEDRTIKGSVATSIPTQHGPGDASSSAVDDCSRNVFNCSTIPAK